MAFIPQRGEPGPERRIADYLSGVEPPVSGGNYTPAAARRIPSSGPTGHAWASALDISPIVS